MLDNIGKHYNVNDDQVFCTGLSMGGFGTWAVATYAPDRFAALAPICGGGEKDWANYINHIPVWAFHGAKDPGVPVARSEHMAAAMKKKNGHVKLTIYPDGKHNVWTETYDNPALYEWLLQQKRTKPGTTK